MDLRMLKVPPKWSDHSIKVQSGTHNEKKKKRGCILDAIHTTTTTTTDMLSHVDALIYIALHKLYIALIHPHLE